MPGIWIEVSTPGSALLKANLEASLQLDGFKAQYAWVGRKFVFPSQAEYWNDLDRFADALGELANMVAGAACHMVRGGRFSDYAFRSSARMKHS